MGTAIHKGWKGGITIGIFLLVVGAYAMDITIKYHPEDFRFVTQNGYTRILSDNYFPDDTMPGYPELQVHYLTIILPPNKKVVSYSVSITETKDLATEHLIYPVQENIPTDGTSPTWTDPDPRIYRSFGEYPERIVQYIGSGIFDGAVLATFKVYPMTYVPSRGTLRLHTSMELSIGLGDTVYNIPIPTVRGEECQSWYDSYLKTVVYNKTDIDAYYLRPSIVPESELWPDYYTVPPKAPFLIVTNSALLSTLKPLQDWLIKRGIPAAIAKTSDIYSHYSGATREEKIRNYLIDAYTTAGLTFVLLVGDTSVVPAKYCDTQYAWYRDTIPNDAYYSDLSSAWYGPSCQGYDRHGEVFVGRIAVKSTESSLVENYIHKYLTFTFDPPNSDLAYHALWLFSQQFPVCTTQVKPLYPDFFVHHYGPDITGEQTEDSLSVGYMWASVYAHGWSHGWWTNNNSPPSTFQSNFHGSGNVPGLTNHNRFFLLYSINCDNAEYDRPYPEDSCMANAMVDLYPDPPRAAIVFLGNTRFGFIPGSEGFHKTFARAYFRSVASVYFYPTVGYAEAVSKALLPYFDYIHFSHNLFGSPDIYIWTEPPDPMRLKFVGFIPLGPQEFTVKVKTTTGRPIPRAKVTIYKPGGTGIYPDVYQTGYTDGEGKVTFNIDPATRGYMYITATRFIENYLPALDSCYVGSPPPTGGVASSSTAIRNKFDILLSRSLFSSTPHFTLFAPYKTDVDLLVYDGAGRVVYFDRVALERGLSTYHLKRNLSAGVYWIQLKTKESEILKKFVVIK